MTLVKNLGQLQALFISTTPPDNTYMLWYDTNTGVNSIKYYDIELGQWVLLSSGGGVSVGYSYRADRVILSTTNPTVVSFSLDLGTQDTDIVLNANIYDANGDEVVGTITNITKSGFTVEPSVTGTIHYRATLRK